MTEEKWPSPWLERMLEALNQVVDGAAWAGVATWRREEKEREEAMEYMLQAKKTLLKELYRIDAQRK